MSLFIYVVLVFLVLRFSVTLFNFLSNPKLNKYGKRYTDLVSIVVSSSSGQDLSVLLKSIEDQDYQNLEVIISAKNEEEKKAVDSARGKYILFLDANMVIGKGLINSLVYRSKIFNLSVISLVPVRKITSTYDWCIIPLRDFIVLNMFPLRLVRFTGNTAFAIANIDCMFVEVDSYKLNRSGNRMEALLANGLLTSTDSTDRSSGLQLLPVFGNNIMVALLYLILVVAGPLLMFVYVDPAFAALPVGLIFLSRLMISFLTNENPIINVMLHPVQMIFLTWSLIREIGARIFRNLR